MKEVCTVSNELLDTIEEIINPILQMRNVTLVDLQYVRQGKDNYLRIFIDKAGGVDLDECTRVSELVSERLDEDDPINGAYFLEVSSPGAERPLKTKEDFLNHLDHNVFVSLYVHIDGQNQYEGILKDFSDDVATIEYRYKHTKKLVKIPYDKIAKARLAVML